MRENGGQYTHAAIWAIMAFVRLGDSQRAWELFSMINPANHTQTPEQTAVYKAEPYVMAADVYAAPQHAGRGGWTWYTGSAGWMYLLIVESLLGLRLEKDRLHCTPCIPAEWDGFTVHYRFRETVYHIVVRQSHEDTDAASVSVDGVEQLDGTIPLVNDQIEHTVVVKIIGAPLAPIEAATRATRHRVAGAGLTERATTDSVTREQQTQLFRRSLPGKLSGAGPVPDHPDAVHHHGTYTNGILLR